MILVRSSAMRAIGYDSATQILSIEFKQGRVYDYHHVPQYIFDGLLNASSKGSYYDRNIKDRY